MAIPPNDRSAKTKPASLVSVALERKPAHLSASMVALAAGVLKSPHRTVAGLGRAVGELARVVRGASNVSPASGDRRFDDPTWRDSALYRRMMQGHLALARETHRLAGELGLSPRDEARAKMMLGMAADSLAPANTLLGNPAALKRTLESGERNLIAGAAQLIEDWRHNGGLPASVDTSRHR